MCLHRWFCGVLVAGLAAGMTRAADTERNPKPDPNGLPMILDRIRSQAEKDEWKSGEWSDATIEKWLENATGLACTAAGRAEYKLPIKFADAKPAAAGARLRAIEGGLLTIGKNVEVAHANRMIILADGNADVSFADGCIIVARGVVSIAHCNNSVVVSGTAVEISHDGNGGRGAAAGSVVLCRGWVNISHAHGTCIVAHEGTNISHAQGVAFVGGNVKAPPSLRGAPNTTVKLPPSFPVEPRMPHGLEKKLTVVGAVQPKGLVFRFGDKRYVADVNMPIVNEAGEKVPGLESWQATFVGDELAVMSNGHVDVPFRLPSR